MLVNGVCNVETEIRSVGIGEIASRRASQNYGWAHIGYERCDWATLDGNQRRGTFVRFDFYDDASAPRGKGYAEDCSTQETNAEISKARIRFYQAARDQGVFHHLCGIFSFEPSELTSGHGDVRRV